MTLRERFEEFAARVGEGGRPGAVPRPGGPTPPAFHEDYWEAVRDLFTRDVTAQQFQELVEREARDTFHFFARGVDFSPLRSRPWYERYPLAAWRLFLAMAHRLSPPRRVLFALGVPLLVLGWLRYLAWGTPWVFLTQPAYTWTLAAASLLMVLLLLELKDKLTLKGDLEIARQIQFGLLPFEPLERGDLALRAAMRPANTVGGDYFDVIDLEDERVGLVIGDVAGKGMPAALLMALLQGSLRTLVTAGFRGAELTAKLNAHLCAHIPSNRLVTLFYGEVGLASGTLRYVNAGHNAPFLARADGTLESLSTTSVALGIIPDAAFTLMETPFDPGDRLVLYTDGIVEAFDPREEEYGEPRLRALLETHSGADPAVLIDRLLEDVLRFCGTARPRDDMTVLIADRRRR